ncbi:Gfo/Idh/MocA family protein [Polaribacter marinivivus]|uniref:Gfo/Idh/MocA family protein n=1 Tax=Polaribacter marinivivus TaxID=1524260 RepID=A0ABV8RBJ6_9FLAO
MLNFAVIGCGNLAMKYAIPALINSGVSRVIVCIDPNRRGQREAIKEKFNLPLVTTIDEAIKKYDFDAVYIAAPTGAHREIVLSAASFNKHILCEKSLGSNLNEVKEMVNFCKERNLALFEGFMYQFHTQHQFVRKLIDDGEIGVPFHFLGRFGFPPINENDFRYKKELGGGVVLDAGAYTVHAARHLFGKEPVASCAILENEDKEVDVRGTVLLDFGNSNTASLIFGFNNMYQSNYVIWGSKGKITLERAYALPPNFNPTCTLEKQGFKEVYTLNPCDHFVEEFKYFCKNYKNEIERVSWYNEAINQSKVLNDFFR